MELETEAAAEKARLKRMKHDQILKWSLEIPEMVENGLKNVFMELLNLHGSVEYNYLNGKIEAEYRGKRTPKEMELHILYNLDNALADLTNIQMRRKGLSMIPGGFLG